MTAGLSVFWFAFYFSAMPLSLGLISGIALSLITILGYLAYRIARGWTAIPPRHQLRLGAPSQGRISLGILSFLLVGLAGVAIGIGPGLRTSGPSGYQPETTTAPAPANDTALEQRWWRVTSEQRSWCIEVLEGDAEAWGSSQVEWDATCLVVWQSYHQ